MEDERKEVVEEIKEEVTVEEETTETSEEVVEEVVETTEEDDEEEVEGISIISDDIDIDDEEIQFPEYYTTTLVGSTPLLCVDEESGSVTQKTLDEIAAEEDLGKVVVYSADKDRSSIITSEIDLVIPEEAETTVYKVTLTNGVQFTCGGSTQILMCNGVWIPLKTLEHGDNPLGIRFNNTNITEDKSGVIIPTALEIESIEKIENNTENTYGILSEHCNILLHKALNDKEISFVILQQ